MQYYVVELPQESMAQETFGARQVNDGNVEVRSRRQDDRMLIWRRIKSLEIRSDAGEMIIKIRGESFVGQVYESAQTDLIITHNAMGREETTAADWKPFALTTNKRIILRQYV